VGRTPLARYNILWSLSKLLLGHLLELAFKVAAKILPPHFIKRLAKEVKNFWGSLRANNRVFYYFDQNILRITK